MKWNHVHIPIAVSVCLIALLATRSRTESSDLTGVWLTTLVFPGRSPIQAAITFEEASPASPEGPVRGHWTKINANEFSIAFRLPREHEAGSDVEYRVTSVLKLDHTLGRLRGPVSCDVLDASGSVVSTLQGAAKASRVSLDNKPK